LNSLFKGILFVGLGASSYGMLATVVKLCYSKGFTTAEVTISQYVFALLLMFILNKLITKHNNKATNDDIKKLIISGTSMGFTSVFYYLSVKYINASIAVVLLMQSVWIGVLLEIIFNKTKISFLKIFAVVLVLIGTVLATNILKNDIVFDLKGFLFGFLAAISFSITLFSTNIVAKYLHPFKRSLNMLYGGGIVVLIFALLTQLLPTYGNINLLPSDFITVKSFDVTILYTWGILLSVFGTILPPILLNKGFPLVGVGLGSIISALELPVSVTFAYFLLDEKVSLIQWLGIFIILGSIFLINLKMISKNKK